MQVRVTRGLVGLLVSLLVIVLLLWCNHSSDSTASIHAEHEPPERGTPSSVPDGDRGLDSLDPSSVGTVFGVVLDGAGAPVADATICAIRTPVALPLPTRSCARSNAEGEYRLTLSVASWTLGASADGFAPSRWGPGRRSNRLWIKAGEQQRFDFVLLEPGRAIAGVVRDAFGGPIADAFVTVGSHPGISEPGALARSDEDGVFTLTIPQRVVMITAYAAGYFPSSTVASTDDVELVLMPETLLRGVVVWDADSQPVAEAEVFLRGSGSQATTDEHGRFELSLNPSRSNVLVASADAGHASLELAPGLIGEHQKVELRLEPAADLELSVVVGEEHEPCREGFVRFEDPPVDVWGYIPVDERVQIRGVPVGRQSVRVGCHGTLETNLQLQLVHGIAHEQVVLERAPRVTGRVITADGARAVLAHISISGEVDSGDVASLEGEFIADYLPPGIYEIEARSERLGQGGLVSVDTREGDIEVELLMRQWAPVRGRVVDTHGSAVAGLHLSLVERPEPRPRGLATTASDGTFAFPAVRSGELQLFARGLLLSRSGDSLQENRVELVHDADIATEFELVVEARDRQIDLRIVGGGGEALPGVRVTLLRLDEELDFTVGTAISDLDGAISFANVPAGDLAVRWPNQTLELLGNERASFELSWQP